MSIVLGFIMVFAVVFTGVLVDDWLFGARRQKAKRQALQEELLFFLAKPKK